jgi:hypothetical protein
MFSIEAKLTHLPATREQVVAVLESINQPHVVLPGKAPQSAQAYVCGLRNQNASFSVFVYLLLKQTQEPVVYLGKDRQFPLEHYRQAEADAITFVESMGFMMENTHFRNQPPDAQEELLKRIPAFNPPVAPGATGGPGEAKGEDGDRLARLLAAF